MFGNTEMQQPVLVVKNTDGAPRAGVKSSFLAILPASLRRDGVATAHAGRGASPRIGINTGKELSHLDPDCFSAISDQDVSNDNTRERGPEECRVYDSSEKAARIYRHFNAAAKPWMESGVPVTASPVNTFQSFLT